MTRRERPVPYVRRKRSKVQSPSRLAAAAGLATVERLEQRQHLFSLTVSPANVGADGLGTVSAIFGYTIPRLDSATDPDVDADAETRTADFSELLPQNIPNNFELDENFLRIRHNVQPPADVRIVTDINADGDVIDGSERLFVRLADSDEFISFEFDADTDEEDPPNDDPDAPLQAVTFDVDRTTGTFGLPFNTVTVTLTLRGETVATFTGAELQARNIGAANGAEFAAGIGTFSFDSANDADIPSPFDRVVITATPGDINAFEIDNIAATLPPPVFTEVVNERVFGAEIRLTGPVGATVQVLDLYGRDIVQTISLGTPDGIDTITLVDIDGDGVPNFNDGIGEIRLSNTDSRTNLSIFGGTIQAGEDDNASTDPNNLPAGIFQEGAGDFAFIYTRSESFIGLFDEFESVGAGYVYDADAAVAGGLPIGQGSVFIGSPFVRDNSSQAAYNPGELATGANLEGPVVTGDFAFVQPDQGIKVIDGSAFGRLTAHAVVHGVTSFPTTVESVNVGALMGSLNVGGDAGTIAIASDAGIWSPDPGINAQGAPGENKTNSQITIGRTANEILVGGRLSSDITVLGDLSDPVNRPARDVLRYTEKEFILAVDENSGIDESQLLGSLAENGREQSILFGANLYRNDLISAAEWVGSAATAVEISGNLGIGDPAIHAEDPGDVYAFAANKGVPITVNTDSRMVEPRIVDRDGRTLAADDNSGFGIAGRQFTFIPETTGIFYLVIQAAASVDGDTDNGQAYTATLAGIAPTLLGSVRAGAGTAAADTESGSITLLEGDAGQISFGSAILDASGGLIAASTVATDNQGDPDDFHSLQSGSYTIPGSLFGFIVGSDIQVENGPSLIRLNVGGNLGLLATGTNPLVAGPGAFTDGDVFSFVANIGGDIAEVDIQGAIGIDQDQPAFSPTMTGFLLSTGVDIDPGSEATGSISVFRTGGAILGRDSLFELPAGATIGAFLVNQDNFIDPAGDSNIGFVNGQNSTSTIFSTGIGADIRFLDVPSIDLQGNQNSQFNLFVGESIEFIDDGGARVTISVDGLASAAPIGFIRALPIDNSEGVAIAEIEANLAGGRSITITSEAIDGSSAPVSIGRLDLTGGTAISDVTFSGDVAIDVWRIIQTGGAGLNEINNNTPGGDLVSVDVVALNQLSIDDGNLGFTELPSFGPERIGPELGIVQGLSGAVGGPLGISAGVLDGDWSGAIYRPTNDPTDDGGTAYLDDIGGPFDTFLDGLVVRTGAVQQVDVAGAIGDVILQGAGAELVELQVNSDNDNNPRFDGIRGVIYAPNIGNINIGDGIEKLEDSPIANAGIFAEDEIATVEGTNEGANISGVIAAADSNDGPTAPNPNPGPMPIPMGAGGIENIRLTSGGDYIDAFIGVTELDFFYQSILYQDTDVSTGDINELSGEGADFFRSQVQAINIDRIEFADGFFDASSVDTDADLNTISATGYRNSTATGAASEFRPNFIVVGEDLEEFTTETPLGDVADIIIEVLGRVENSITANNFIRTDVQVDNFLAELTANSSILGSNIQAGEIPTITAGINIVASNIAVSGDVQEISAGDSIVNTDVSITGADGSLALMTATRNISGSLNAAGPVGSVLTTLGDIDLQVVSTGSNGFINDFTAGRDLILETDISQGVGSLIAGRNIGAPDRDIAILIRSDLATVEAPNGQLFSDINVGGTLGVDQVQSPFGGGGGSPGVVIGTATSAPGADQSFGTGSLLAFERIGPVEINGDFGGSIVSASGGIEEIVINNGSTLPGQTIAAFDGSIESLIINGGHLLSDVFADVDIVELIVNPDSSGTFGDVGVNPSLDPLASFDSFRNELPVEAIPTNAIDGPTIFAGRDIIEFTVSGGSLFETGVHAGRNLVSATIAGDVMSDDGSAGSPSASFFAAGDQLQSVSISGSAYDTLFAAGLFDLGADHRPGGLGDDADTVRAGLLDSVTIGGSADNVDVSVGMLAGDDGLYNTRDESTAIGFSTINTFSVSGAINNVDVSADVIPGSLNGAFDTFGGQFAVENPLVFQGAAPGSNANGLTRSLDSGESFVATLVGAGSINFQASTDTLFISGTDATSSLTILATSATQGLTGLTVASQDNAALASLTVIGDLLGDSAIVIDGTVNAASFQGINTSGEITVGGDLPTFTASDFNAGFLHAANNQEITIAGNFGSTNAGVRGEAKINLLSAGDIEINGGLRGDINVFRDGDTLVATGPVDTALIRYGGSLGSGNNGFEAPSLRRTRISVNNTLGSATIAGDAFDSQILVGADLGADGNFGGTGLDADRATSGNAGPIFIGGNFFESDIVAGALRGPDGFYGTADDSLADGRSTLLDVEILGSGVGSERFSESYRILATGEITSVLIGGAEGADQGNFAIEGGTKTQPVPIQVEDLTVERTGPIYTARIDFNQPIDPASLSEALSVREIRGQSGSVQIFLIEGADYTLSFDEATNAAFVRFDRTITDRDLPQLPGLPGPGLYRFVIDPDLLTGQLDGAVLDGDNDGKPGDQYSMDTVVGDAGDKLISGTAGIFDPVTNDQVASIDFYPPIDLDTLLDDNNAPDGVAETNSPFTIRGVIGDNPDHTDQFLFASDVDLYNITLQAGQILRLGPVQGAAASTQVSVLSPSGELGFIGNADALRLPSNLAGRGATSVETVYLINTTGLYTIAVGNTTDSLEDPSVIPNIPAAGGTTGEYNFTLEVFDDGDSGFADNTDSGDGRNVVNPPLPIDFAGPDRVFGTSDDRIGEQIFRQDFAFSLDVGPDGTPNTDDDTVSGSSADGAITATRADGVVTQIVNAAIGPEGHTGIPSDVFADVDVFNLNGANPIAPGTLITINVGLSEFGADLGSRAGDLGRLGGSADSDVSFEIFSNSVQFALFDTSDATNLTNADIVFSPSDFSPNGGETGVIAERGNNAYGFDENGDFFITFAAPGRIDAGELVSASYAVYLQGAFNTDYDITIETRAAQPITLESQNILIETNGGTIDWLEAGGLTTELAGFDAATLGLAGATDDGTPIDEFLLTGLVENLQSIFDAAGLDVTFSTNPADFEFEEFSTVFLTSSVDPISDLFAQFGFGAFGGAGPDGAQLGTQPFGFAERADALNTDVDDEAVVFVPSHAQLGLTPSQNDVEQLLTAITASVGRHVGELLGLQISSVSGGAVADLQAADSPFNRPLAGDDYILPTLDRALSNNFDTVTSTDFWLGEQNAATLLERILAN